jgi:putative autotransporter adhesin-like protein
MTRTLVLIAGVGFGLTVFCFVLVLAIGGPAAWHSNWHRSWQIHNGSIIIGHDDTPDVDGGGPVETREIAWSGASSLDVDIPVDIAFTQASGPAKLVITGPKGTVDQVEASGSNLDYRDEPENPQRVKIVMTAPDVRSFSLSGDETLSIAGYGQDDLDLDVSGTGRITAQGKTRTVKIDVSGDGDADLGKLAAEEASVDISGSGRTTIAPTDRADVDISGSGEVDLASHPATVHSDVSGSGRIVQGQTTFQ